MNKFLSFCLLCWLCVSCNTENVCNTEDTNAQSLRFFVSDQYPSTRSSVYESSPMEHAIKDLLVLFYTSSDDGSGQYLGCNKIDLTHVSNGGTLDGYELRSVELNDTGFKPTTNCDMLVLANCSDNGYDKAYIESMAQKNVDIDHFQYAFQVPSSVLRTPSSLIMSAGGRFSAKTGATIRLERCMAKIRIALNNKLLGYEIKSLHLQNYRDSAYVISISGECPMAIRKIVTEVVRDNGTPSVAECYTFETFNTSTENRIAVVIGLEHKGVVSYYRLEMYAKYKEQKIGRNRLYCSQIEEVKGYGVKTPQEAAEQVMSSLLIVDNSDWNKEDYLFYSYTSTGVGVVLSSYVLRKEVEDVASPSDTILVYWNEKATLVSERPKITSHYQKKAGGDVVCSVVRSSSDYEPDTILVDYKNGQTEGELFLNCEDLTIEVPVKIEAIPIGPVIVGSVIFASDQTVNDAGLKYFPGEQAQALYNDFCPKGWRIPLKSELTAFMPLFSQSSYDIYPVLTAKNKSTRIILDLGRLLFKASAPTIQKGECYFIAFDELDKKCKTMKATISSGVLSDITKEADARNYLYPLRCVRSYN